MLAFSLFLALPRVASQAQSTAQQQPAASEPSIPLYHRFGAAVTDSMTIRTATFRTQLDTLSQQGYHDRPLRTIVSYRLGKGPRRRRVPLRSLPTTGTYRSIEKCCRRFVNTRFPSPSYLPVGDFECLCTGMTWDQLAELQRTGLFDIQSHTYWHPNSKTEKRRLSPAAYQSFVNTQLTKPRTVLKNKLGVNADLLAWPFGSTTTTCWPWRGSRAMWRRLRSIDAWSRRAIGSWRFPVFS